MPKMHEMFPSKWLAAADLNDSDVTLTVSSVEQEYVGQGDESETKWVVYFSELGKGLVLNKTNATVLTLCLGDDSDDWIGKRVMLYPTEVSFSGKMVAAIRIKDKATRAANKPAAAKPQPARPGQRPTAQPVTQAEADGDDEEIPF